MPRWESVPELSRQLVVYLLAELTTRMVVEAGRGGVSPVVVRAPWERLEGKIQPWHLGRLAVVYVRQSTPQQVLDHAESTRLQYGLTQRAVDLGWRRPGSW
jgi:hypothetical protein